MLSHDTMSPFLGRARGAVLRLARRRTRSIVVGLLLALPAGWVQFLGRSGSWWIQGVSLVVGATGVALLWTGLTGPKPDWMDEGQ